MNLVDLGPGYPLVTIVNVSSTFNLGVYLNTTKIAMTMKDMPVKLNKRKISSMIMNTSSAYTQNTTALIYDNGTVILTGACYEEMSRYCAWVLVGMMNQFGIPAGMINFAINNITGHLELGFPVNLSAAAKSVDCHAVYNPADYTAMRLKDIPDLGHASCLVYPNGRCVVTGVKTREAITKTVRWLVSRMKRHEQVNGTFETSELKYKHKNLLKTEKGKQFLIDYVVDKQWELAETNTSDISEESMVIKSSGARVKGFNHGTGVPYVSVLPADDGLELASRFDKSISSYKPITSCSNE